MRGARAAIVFAALLLVPACVESVEPDGLGTASAELKADKVTLCHVPPGNPANAHTITVGSPAVPAHLAHGDFLGECVAACVPTAEVCGDGVDNDCNGVVDNGCVCTPGSTASCYGGPPGTEGVGACRAGNATCNADGTGYGACGGAVTPRAEVCGDGVDNDCDGVSAACGIGGRAWNDALMVNGLQDAGEESMADLPFILRSAATGAVVFITTSNADGNYFFTGVPAGNYVIEVVPPFSWGPTFKDAGTDDSIDSDFDPFGLTTDVFFYGGGTLTGLDCGLMSST